MSGPVRSWVHSGAELLICSRGSSHDTAKYIEMDIVWACGSLAIKMFIVSQYLPKFSSLYTPRIGNHYEHDCLVVDIGDLLDDEPERVVPRQREVHKAEV